MTKKYFIVEYDEEGILYCYFENKKHHKLSEKVRKNDGLIKVKLKTLRERCKILDGSYLVFKFYD